MSDDKQKHADEPTRSGAGEHKGEAGGQSQKSAKASTPSVQPTTKKVPKASIGTQSATEEPISRRRFFSWLSIAWVAFAGATAAFFTMLARFMFPNVLFEPPQTFKAGYPDEYAIGSVDTRWKARYGVWIVRNAEYIYALSTVCTHLGCTPNWLPSDRKFKCPCHGSGFKITGINFEGPAPRPLERYRIVLAEDGQILIDKSKKYQQEKGQWKDPESFLVV